MGSKKEAALHGPPSLIEGKDEKVRPTLEELTTRGSKVSEVQDARYFEQRPHLIANRTLVPKRTVISWARCDKREEHTPHLFPGDVEPFYCNGYGWGHPLQPETEEREGDQPLPTPGTTPDIQSAVIKDVQDRRNLGITRYGVALQAFNNRDATRDLYEEALDLVMYAKQLRKEQLVREYSLLYHYGMVSSSTLQQTTKAIFKEEFGENINLYILPPSALEHRPGPRVAPPV